MSHCSGCSQFLEMKSYENFSASTIFFLLYHILPIKPMNCRLFDLFYRFQIILYGCWNVLISKHLEHFRIIMLKEIELEICSLGNWFTVNHVKPNKNLFLNICFYLLDEYHTWNRITDNLLNIWSLKITTVFQKRFETSAVHLPLLHAIFISS